MAHSSSGLDLVIPFTLLKPIQFHGWNFTIVTHQKREQNTFVIALSDKEIMNDIISFCLLWDW